MSTLQWPMLAQSELVLHVFPLMLQAPATVPHWESDVQLVFVMLHVPGSGVHTGGAQDRVAKHGFSGSGGLRLHPAGVYVIEHCCGWQVCVPGRLQVCA